MRFHVFILAPFVFLLKETPLMWKNYIVSCFSTTRLPMQEKTKSFTIHEERNKDKCKILLIITIKNMYGKINKGIRILFNLFPWFGPQTILLLMMLDESSPIETPYHHLHYFKSLTKHIYYSYSQLACTETFEIFILTQDKNSIN